MRFRSASFFLNIALTLLLISGTGQSADEPVDFNNVAPPDYRSVFKMYMASQYDLLDEKNVGLEYHMLFEMPRLEAGRAKCNQLFTELNDEFASAGVEERYMPAFREALREAEGWPRTKLIKLTATTRLQQYDQSKQAFPLANYAGPVMISVLRPDDTCLAIAYDSFSPHGLLPRSGRRMGFVIEYNSPSGLAYLPMSPEEGRVYIQAHQREVNVEIIVRTEPVEIKNNQLLPIKAHVLAARILDADNKRVLYVHTTADSGAMEIVEAVGPVIPLTHHMINLFTLRDYPEFVDEEWLLNGISRHIRGEQMRWQEIDKARERNTREFIYEWQKLERENPELANGALLDVFIRPERLWEFVRAEPEWDDRFTPLIEVFLFERNKIEGRNPDFAARELMSVWRRHLRAATGRLPKRFSIETQVLEPQYDHDAGYFRIEPRYRGLDKTNPHLFAPVVDPSFSVPAIRERTEAGVIVHPDAARSGVLYQIAALPFKEDDTMARSVELQYRRFLRKEDVPEMWRESLREFTSYGSSTPTPGGPYGFYFAQTMVLDRWLKPMIIPAVPQDAEALMAKMHGDSRNAIGDGNIKIRMIVRPTHVEMASRYKRRDDANDTPVLFAELESVLLLNMSEELIAEFGPEDFPSAASMSTALARRKDAKNKKTQRPVDQRRAINERYAQCATMPNIDDQIQCYDAMLDDRETLKLTSKDLSNLQQVKQIVAAKRSEQDHMATVMKQMRPYQKCQAITDAGESYQCMMDVRNEQREAQKKCMAMTDIYKRNECLGGL